MTHTKYKVRLRALEPGDVDCIYLWENNPEMWKLGFSPAPLSRQQIWEYIDSYDSNPLAERQLRLMVVDAASDVPVGAVDLYDIDIRNRRAFVGIMIAPASRRCGYAGEALGQIMHYCRENLGLHQLLATITDDNKASLSLFRRSGFRQMAKLTDWVRVSEAEYCDAKILRKKLFE